MHQPNHLIHLLTSRPRFGRWPMTPQCVLQFLHSCSPLVSLRILSCRHMVPVHPLLVRPIDLMLERHQWKFHQSPTEDNTHTLPHAPLRTTKLRSLNLSRRHNKTTAEGQTIEEKGKRLSLQTFALCLKPGQMRNLVTELLKLFGRHVKGTRYQHFVACSPP